MGLSASQARLLSITRRLNNNELQSEFISNSKIQLANQNVKASDKYINALDSTKMEYVSYDDTGIQETVALTFNSMTQYTPLKNQYNLYNTEGQILVSPTDASNFKNSKTLYQFLDCYGLFNHDADEEFQEAFAKYQKQIEDFNKKQQEYNDKITEFNEKLSEYQTKLDDYNKKLEDYQDKQKKYEEDLKKYEESLNSLDLYGTFSSAVGKSDELLAIPSTSNGLPDGLELSKGCYWSALHPDGTENRASCYTHVLGHLLDYDATTDRGCTQNPYKTSAGDVVNFTDCSGGYMDNTCNPEMGEVSKGINEKNPDGSYKRVCDGNDDYRGITGVGNALEKALNDYAAGNIDATELKMWRLISDYYQKPDGTMEVKSLRQKVIDMMYLSLNWGYSEEQSGEFPYSMLNSDQMVDILINFTDGDLQKLTLDPPEMPTPPEEFNDPMPVLNISPPIAPEEPVYIQKFYDQPLAQWYINLWNAMEGANKSDKLRSIGDEEANFSYYTTPDKARKSTFDEDGNQTNQYYQIIDKNLVSDSNWIQFALTNGIVTMKQAALRSNGDITWAGVEFSSTSDIREVQDDTKIAKAEAEYNKVMQEIQAQDKKYDQDLHKLDTEHSAMKQEIDSIKNVISKNVERSFAAFS